MDIHVWVKKMQKLINQMPENYEGIVSYNDIAIYPRGTLDAHMSTNPGFGITTDVVDFIKIGPENIVPYPEGT